MHFIFIFFSLSTQSIALALASFVCLPTAADQLVVFCFVFFYFFFSCLLCGEGISFFFCVHFCAHSSCHRRTRWSCLFSWTLCVSFFLFFFYFVCRWLCELQTAPLCSWRLLLLLLLLLKWNLCVCVFGGFRVKPNWFLLVRVMGLLRTMTVLRVHPASPPPHHDSSAGSWNKRMRHLSSPVLYLTALLA